MEMVDPEAGRPLTLLWTFPLAPLMPNEEDSETEKPPSGCDKKQRRQGDVLE